MELPDDILIIIKEYSMPITRPDWRKGCYFNRYPYKIRNKDYTFKYLLLLICNIYKNTVMELYINMLLTEIMMVVINNE